MPIILCAVFLCAGLFVAEPTAAAVPAALSLALAVRARGRLVSLAPLARAGTIATLTFVLGACDAKRIVDRADRAAALLGSVPARALCSGYLPPTGTELRASRCLVGSSWVELPLRVVPRRDTPALARGPVAFTGRIDRPPRADNPGDPDERRRSRRSGIAAWVYVSATDTVRSFAPRAGSAAGSVRRRLGALYSEDVPGALVRAMLTGDSRLLPDSVRTAFRRTGIAHVLAVSGLHVGILLALCIVAATVAASRLPWRSRQAATLLVVAASLVCAVLVVGARPSVLRAAILAALLFARSLGGRAGRGALPALALSVIVQLVWNPAWLFDPGFQLTHAAVLGLITRRRGRPGIAAGISASARATWFTAPFVAHHFGPVPLGGIVLNLAAIPLTSIVVSAGLLSLAASPVSATAADAAHAAAGLLASLALRFEPFAGPLAVRMEAGMIVALSIVRPGRRDVVPLLAALSLWLAGWIPVEKPLDVTMLSTGQGDATVVTTPSGSILVVDAGPGTSRSLLRHLARRGVSRVDLLVLSHAHADHVGGVDALVQAVAVGRVVTPPGFDPAVAARLAASGAVIRQAVAGDTLRLDEAISLLVMSPSRATAAMDANENSLILRVSHGHTSFLFAGDAERSAERALVTDWAEFLSSDVVKVPHHGSATSSSAPFVLRTRPSVAVVSVGRNPYGLPVPAVLRRWAAAGANVHLTSLGGAACFRSNGRGIETGCR